MNQKSESMNQNEQLTSKAIEMQRTTLENSQEALEQAMELPVEQTLEFQKRAAQLFLDGLEMSSWAQNQGVELTRDAFNTYIDTVEDTVRDTTEFTEGQMQQMTTGAQQMTRQQPMTDQMPPTGQPAQSRAQAPPMQGNAGGPIGGAPGPAPGQYQPPAGQSQQPDQQYANPAPPAPAQQPQQAQPIQQTQPVPQPTQQRSPPTQPPAPRQTPSQQQSSQSTTETESENAETPPERS